MLVLACPNPGQMCGEHTTGEGRLKNWKTSDAGGEDWSGSWQSLQSKEMGQVNPGTISQRHKL